MASPRQLAAIMFTDIVDYTALMQRNEQEAVALTKRYLSVLHQATEAHAGKILNDYGDGSLCIFPSAMDALQCATEVQQQLQAPPVVPLRIGLHIGEIFFEDGKVFGDGVNIASRIQSLGTGGSVLFSREVYKTIKNRPELQPVALGSFEFKDAEASIEVFALGGEGFTLPRRGQKQGRLKSLSGTLLPAMSRKRWIILAGTLVLVLAAFLLVWTTYPGSKALASTRAPNSIAVLYFNNLSGDPGQEYFSDGMTEEIITRLSMIEGLRVKSRTSVLQYKGKTKSTRQIARDLGVKHILEGSVRKQGNQLRITVQLIDATRDEHVWVVNYDRELKDVFAVQSDIAQHIADKFQIRLSDQARKKLNTPPTRNTDAYDLYLRANSLTYLNFGFGGTHASRLTAMDLLRKALQLDPAFAEAYALLSINFTYMGRDAKDPRHWIDSAQLLARSAIQYGPEKVDGYAALAVLNETTGNLDEALKWWLKCHEIRPYYQAIDIAGVYSRKQNYGKAMEWTQEAIRYDPAEPLNYVTKSFLFYELGMLDSMKQNIDAAIRLSRDRAYQVWSIVVYYRVTHNLKEFEQLIKRDNSQDERVYNFNMGIFHLFGRNWQTADSFYRLSTHPDDMDAGLARLHLGDTKTAGRYFDNALAIRLKASGIWDHWRYYDISRIYAARRDPRYLEYLQKAIRKGWHEYPFFQQDPFFDAVRSTPEFQKIAATIHQRNEAFKADLMKKLQATSYKLQAGQ